MSHPPTLFADGIVEATARNGVARLTLAVQDGKGQPVPTGILAVPLSQLGVLAGAMNRLMQEIEAKAREGAARTAPSAAPAAPEEPTAFRFQG